MEIKCVMLGGFSYTKADLEKLASQINKAVEAIVEVWQTVKEVMRNMVDAFRNLAKEIPLIPKQKQYYPMPRVPLLKSQVLENKPRYSRIRNNI